MEHHGKQLINIKERFFEFVAISEGKTIYKGNIGTEIICPFAKEYLIEFSSKNSLIVFFNNIQEKSLSLTMAEFKFKKIDINILNEIGKYFELTKKNHQSGYFSYKINANHYDHHIINFKKYNNDYFCIIYGVRRERGSIYGRRYVFRKCFIYLWYMASRTFRRV